MSGRRRTKVPGIRSTQSMSTSKTPSNIVISVACGPVPCDTEKGRSFLQQRQALFGKVCCLLGLGLYAFLNLLGALGVGLPWSEWVTRWDNQLLLGACVAFLAIHLTCRARPFSHLQLSLIDTFGMLLIGVLIGLNYCPKDLSEHTEYMGALALTNLLLLRAIIVPSSAPQTLMTGALASIPVVIGFHVAFSDFAAEQLAGGQASPDSSAAINTAVLGAWCVIAVAVATFASSIIYGLQQEVEGAKQLGQYTLEERIGRGGMGEVFKASHAMLRRPTAIKLLRPENAGERSLARFEREVQLTSLLTHPNTIAIYDFGHTPDGVFYYAMEYLDGVDLEDLVEADGAQPASRIIHVLRQICASLIEAHAAGLIHRDIKPANVILCERGGVYDFVKLVDFGLVKDVENRANVNLSGAHSIMGSPLYMSPEAMRAPESVDARSDLYSVGAVGYYLLTGTPLFEGSNLLEIGAHHLHTPPEPPSERVKVAIPEDLEKVVLRCLEKDPADRPASARELKDALEACRDAGGWSQEAAAAWWEKSASRIKATSKAVEVPAGGNGSTQTVATAVLPESGAAHRPSEASSEALTRDGR